MADGNDLFQKTDDPAPVTEPTPVSPEKNYLEDLVGEGKKYASVEDLARSRIEADQFIERLKGENQGIREELKTRATLEAFMDRMEQQKPVSQVAENQQSTTQNTPPAENAGEQISQEKLESLLEKKLSEREQQSTQTRNLQQVTEQLQKHFGADFQRHLKQKASELGLGEDFLDGLAKTQPRAFTALLGIDGEPSQKPEDQMFNQTAPVTQQNTTAQRLGTPVGLKNKAYFDKIKRDDPDRYWSVSVQNELHREALAQAEDFYN
jgi:hypothetical protein